MDNWTLQTLQTKEYLERPFPVSVHSCLCGWSYLIYFLIWKLLYSTSSEPSRTVIFLDVMYTTDPHHRSKSTEYKMTEQKCTVPLSYSSQRSIAAIKNILADGR